MIAGAHAPPEGARISGEGARPILLRFDGDSVHPHLLHLDTVQIERSVGADVQVLEVRPPGSVQELPDGVVILPVISHQPSPESPLHGRVHQDLPRGYGPEGVTERQPPGEEGGAGRCRPDGEAVPLEAGGGEGQDGERRRGGLRSCIPVGGGNHVGGEGYPGPRGEEALGQGGRVGRVGDHGRFHERNGIRLRPRRGEGIVTVATHAGNSGGTRKDGNLPSVRSNGT